VERWRAGRRLTPASVAAFFVLFAAATSYPLILQPGTLVGSHGDAMFSVWRLAWVAHQLRADPFHLFDANIFFPETRTLAYSDAMLLPAVIWAPVQWAGVSPVAASNILLLLAFVLNGLSAWLLVRHLSGSALAGVFGGLVFAFAPFRFDHFHHLELQFSFWMPLAVLAWHRGLETGRAHHFWAAAGLTGCQVLSCIYYGVFLLTWFSVATVATSFAAPRTMIVRLAQTLVAPTLVLAVYSLPYLANRQTVGERSAKVVAEWSAKPGDFLSAQYTNVLYGWTHAFAAPERHLFIGVMALTCALVGLWPLTDRVRGVHAAGVMLGVLLALGFNAFLYPVLFEWVLPYRGLRVPARAMVMVLLSVAVLAGLGVARIQSGFRARPQLAIAALAIGVASTEYFSRPSLKTVPAPASSWYATLARLPDAVVFEWPVSHPTRITEMIDVLYMYRSTLHWRPLLNGYSGKYPNSYLDLLVEMRSFPDGNSIAHLQRAGATVLVIHEVPGSRPSYEYAFDRLARDASVTVIAQDRDADRRIAFFRLAPARTR
jgi:hypothetical protein